MRTLKGWLARTQPQVSMASSINCARLDGDEVHLHLLRIELRHLHGFRDQPVQAVALLIDNGEQLLACCPVRHRPRAAWSPRL